MISHFPRVLFSLENRLLFLTTNVFISVWSPAIDMMSQSTLITSLFPTPCIIISLYQDQEKDLFMVFEYMKVKRKQLPVLRWKQQNYSRGQANIQFSLS